MINQIAFATESDCAVAYEAARTAFPGWASLTVAQRGQVLLRAAALLRERVTDLARLEVWDTGKPVSEALSVDVLSAADTLEYFAKIAVAMEGSVILDPAAHIFVTHEPL